MEDNLILKVDGANKTYGKKIALDDLSINLEKGKVLGLLGPNGSGKTTLLKAIVGLVKLDSGQVLIDGVPVGIETRKVVSFLPDSNYFTQGLKVKDCIKIFADFFEDFSPDKCHSLLGKMNIDPNTRLSEMSKGYVERVNVCLVMSRKAKLFILDEPIGGVDPLARDMILDTIIENIGDASLIVTTQLISSMEKIFDDVCFIKDGEIALNGGADRLIEEKGMPLEAIYKSLYD